MTRQILLYFLVFLLPTKTCFSTEKDNKSSIKTENSEKNYTVQQKSSVNNTHIYYNQAESLKFSMPDSAIELYYQSFDIAGKEKDSLQMGKTMAGLANLYAHNGKFGYAYDSYWEALTIADKIEDIESKAIVYNGLGWLYSFYERNTLSLDYFNKAITILKNNKSINQLLLVDNYYAVATLKRKSKNTNEARLYLDSCLLVKKENPGLQKNNAFINAEFGYNFYEDEEYEKALKILLPLEPYFSEFNHSYLVIYHYFLGNIYNRMGKLKTSEKYYRSAINTGLIHHTHSDLFPIIYEELSTVLLKLNKTKEAYKMLKISKDFNENQYGSRNTRNRRFLEIKDEFRKKQEQEEELLREQELERLTQESRINYLKNIIFYVTIIGLISVVFFVYRTLRNKYKAKQILFIEKQKMEEQKVKEVLDIKNKELTASVLQIIQHEETLAEIKNDLAQQKKEPDANQINKIAKKINLNTNNNWKEFEARFIEVNGHFYEELNARFPKLTQGDQKICALIKLNFDSKGMSKLLGISTESVHTTRYRLRKKLGLERQDNLEEFISQIG
ncbi:tetratricopeptide repeat protein [Flammeovirga pectinis]|uniref:Tetratricopeptide repeat protein n=1 Tax=Flammeovirga pectinis TaxID=2494373 RepID=A0A3Q9FTE2_9BACT|nr:tetratricopeptide repeat protein [Flammeovirga pectinis]AZQ65559.1 tetratricopeptide repeat protein [Flammeovirga pectinis]